MFVEAQAHALESRDQAIRGYKALKELKERFYGVMGSIDSYLEPDGQRIYCAEPLRFWINKSARDQSGAIIRDHRYEITLADLLE